MVFSVLASPPPSSSRRPSEAYALPIQGYHLDLSTGACGAVLRSCCSNFSLSGLFETDTQTDCDSQSFRGSPAPPPCRAPPCASAGTVHPSLSLIYGPAFSKGNYHLARQSEAWTTLNLPPGSETSAPAYLPNNTCSPEAEGSGRLSSTAGATVVREADV